VIVGKGMAWSRAEAEVRDFVERTQLPFLATPMGKGMIPDDHPLSVGAARSYALQNADLVMLLGARLNWILHFGLPPRFAPDVRVVQLDIAPEEIGTNVPTEVGLIGDGKAVMRQVNQVLESSPWQYPAETTWRSGIANKIAENHTATQQMIDDDSSPMNYYHVLRAIHDLVPRDAIIVNEGANTMDIGRVMLPNYEPRSRLDAGTFGTMGVGLGFAVAAGVVNRPKRVVCVEGDSAFGFSGMEIETACRYKLPITFVIVNNNGIGGGPTEFDPEKPIPANAYTPQAHYERMIEAFGGAGYYVTESSELQPALQAAMKADGPALVNIMISNRAGRKPQEFRWLTT
ncbi:MAG: thiamine pyrophosphate-dependent enzyme, partial [Dehalococcoidia bacterium]